MRVFRMFMFEFAVAEVTLKEKKHTKLLLTMYFLIIRKKISTLLLSRVCVLYACLSLRMLILM